MAPQNIVENKTDDAKGKIEQPSGRGINPKLKTKSCSACLYTRSEDVGEVEIAGSNGLNHSCKNGDASCAKEIVDKKIIAIMPETTASEAKIENMDYIGPITDIDACIEFLQERQRQMLEIVPLIKQYKDERDAIVVLFHQIHYFFKTNASTTREMLQQLSLDKNELYGLNLCYEENFLIKPKFDYDPSREFYLYDIKEISKRIRILSDAKESIDKALEHFRNMSIEEVKAVPFAYEKHKLPGLFTNDENKAMLKLLKAEENGLYKLIKYGINNLDIIFSIITTFATKRELLIKCVHEGLSQAKIIKRHIQSVKMAQNHLSGALILKDKSIPAVNLSTKEEFDIDDYAGALVETGELLKSVNILHGFFTETFIKYTEEDIENALNTKLRYF